MSLFEAARERIEPAVRGPLAPLVRALAGAGVTPNQVTLGALVLASGAAGLTVAGWHVAAAVVLLLSGGLDLLDGMLARHTGRTSAFGAFLDSTLDRVSEGVVFAAVAYHFAVHGQPALAGVATLALLGSVLVSYARARAEALGLDCKVGAMTRAERLLALVAGLAFGLLGPVVLALAVLGAFTVVQRMVHVHRQLRSAT